MEAIYQLTTVLNDASAANVLRLFQQCVMQQQNTMGIGCEEMRRRGLLWMIADQKLVFERQPACPEEVTVTTWLSEARHGLYLRHYELSGTDGAVICRAVADWMLVDEEERTLSQISLAVPTTQKENQLPRFPLLPPVETEREFSFTVPHSYLDENGHMNNACYFEAAAPVLPRSSHLCSAQVDYHREACEGENLSIGYVSDSNVVRIQATGERGLCFRMKLEYT